MKKSPSCLLLLAMVALGVSSASAATVASFNFEADVTAWFSFAENGGNISVVQVIPGVGGTDGISTRIIAAPGSYAGGGMGGPTAPIDLAVVGITPGTFTTAQLDNVRVKFDVNLPIGQSISVRLEAGNGGYSERLDLTGAVNGTGAFQTVNLDASLGLAAQKTTMVNFMNSGNATGVKFIFGINNQSAVPIPTDFVFDNLDISYVPEPSSAMVLSVVGLLGLARRRR